MVEVVFGSSWGCDNAMSLYIDNDTNIKAKIRTIVFEIFAMLEKNANTQ